MELGAVHLCDNTLPTRAFFKKKHFTLTLQLRLLAMCVTQPDGIKVPTTQIAQRAKFNVAKWAQNQGLPATPTAAVHFTTRAGS